MDEEETPVADSHSAITTEEGFHDALRTLVAEADAGGVDVRGGWPVRRADTDRAWDVEVTRISTRSTASIGDAEFSAAAAVVQTVAEREDTAATDLPPLYDAIGPDILEVLDEADPDSNQSVTFDYAGYTITVDADGTIVVDE